MTSRAPCARAMRATIAFASAPSRAQCTVAARARHRRLQPLELLGQRRHRARLDRRAGVAQRLPVRQLPDRPRALGADRRRRLAEVAPQLRVRPASRARPPGSPCHSCAARISARCIVRTPARWRRSAPPMCIRHELSAAVQTSARVSSTRRSLSAEHRHRRVGVLDRERPAEAAALVRVLELHEVDPAHRRQQPPRPVADVQQPQRVAGRVQRHAVRERGADVGHARAGRPGTRSARTAARARRRHVLAHVADARGRRRDDDLVAARTRAPSAGQRRAVLPVARVAVHLPAARLLLREHDLVAEPLEQRRRPPARSPGTACR